MKTVVVFVSKDHEEYKRYVNGLEKELEDSRLEAIGAFLLERGSHSVFVIEGFPEKDACANSQFSEKDLTEFLKSLSKKLDDVKELKDAGRHLNGGKGKNVWRDAENFRLFVHWGGSSGTCADLEAKVKTALDKPKTTTEAEWKKFGGETRAAFAISTRRPDLFDLRGDPIRLPSDEDSLTRLIRKAECGALLEFWTKCAVFGAVRSCDCGDKTRELARNVLQDKKLAMLESHLSIKEKQRRIKMIEVLLGALMDLKGAQGKSVVLEDDVCKFLNKILNGEDVCG